MCYNIFTVFTLNSETINSGSRKDTGTGAVRDGYEGDLG